jgi:putative endonuclease
MLKTSSQEFGINSENIAARYLQNKGFTILVRNYRYKRAEIDIIARKNACLYFVEVKARKSTSFGYPEEAVTKYKQSLIKEAAENYILEYNWDDPIRFDIIAISQQRNNIKLFHLEDAF